MTPADQIEPARLPAPFARVLGYCAQQLGVAAPPVYRRADFADDAHVGAARPPLLLAGPHALALADNSALAFRLGRALTYVLPGRAVAGSLPSRQLKQTMLAALTLAQPSLHVEDPDGEVKSIRVALTGAAPSLAREIAAAVRAHRRRLARDAQPRPLRPRSGAHRRSRRPAFVQ